MSALGKTEESDEWFQNWIREESDHLYAVASYILCLEEREQYEEAKELLSRYLTENASCTEANDMLFYHAGIIYEHLGEHEKAERYMIKLQARIQEVNEELESLDWGEDLFFSTKQEPIVKEKKIYPNDPCPCGSGKKYKKCCGKNR